MNVRHNAGQQVRFGHYWSTVLELARSVGSTFSHMLTFSLHFCQTQKPLFTTHFLWSDNNESPCQRPLHVFVNLLLSWPPSVRMWAFINELSDRIWSPISMEYNSPVLMKNINCQTSPLNNTTSHSHSHLLLLHPTFKLRLSCVDCHLS